MKSKNDLLLKWIPYISRIIRTVYKWVEPNVADDLVQEGLIGFMSALDKVDMAYTEKEVFSYCMRNAKWSCAKFLQRNATCGNSVDNQSDRCEDNWAECLTELTKSLYNLSDAHRNIMIKGLLTDQKAALSISSSQFSRVKIKFYNDLKQRLAS